VKQALYLKVNLNTVDELKVLPGANTVDGNEG
jgi:hypothetical protein